MNLQDAEKMMKIGIIGKMNNIEIILFGEPIASPL